MNKVILMGRLVKDPDVKYSQGAQPIAVARYTLACNRRFKREGEPDADFIGCVALGKSGEFAEKYFKKGQQVSVVGRLQVRTYEKDGVKHWSTEVVIEEQYFAESKNNGNSTAPAQNNPASAQNNNGFYPIDNSIDDDDLPF